MNVEDDPAIPLPSGRGRVIVALVVIAGVALGLRAWGLGGPSVWYDEAVTMRLARQPTPSALLELLPRIDHSRAPLHPLGLQVWLRLFGTSEAAGRSLSVLAGVVTVVLMFAIGRRLYDDRTALWASWLGAVSPPLVRWSREIRMYSCLVAVVCLSWWLLLMLRTRRSWPWWAGYVASLSAIAYLHPLGLFVLSTHAVVSLLGRRAFGMSWGRWVAVQAAVGALIAPIMVSYLAGRPDYLQEGTSLRLLLATPIGFVGGNSLAFLACLGLIAWGALRWSPRAFSWDHPGASALLACWCVLPLGQLALYSALRHPIVGPDRYTLYIAPAYLLLLARGLARLPAAPRWGVAALGLGLSAQLLGTLVFDRESRPGWREVAAIVSRERPRSLVVMLPSDTRYLDKELDAARYYLGQDLPILPVDEALEGLSREPPALARPWVVVVGRRGGRELVEIPPALRGPGPPASWDVPGMRIYLARGEGGG